MLNSQVPLTPPEDTGNSENAPKNKDTPPLEKKVTFDLVNAASTQDTADQDPPEDTPLLSPCVDIQAQRIPDTMLVALLDRPEEMKELFQRNQPFFSSLHFHLGEQWPRLQQILLLSRAQMCDQSWLEAIEITLHQAPPALFSTFKELVGYMGQDSTLQNQSLDQDTPFQHVELGAIRRHPSCLNHLFTNYPQFMINCQQALSEKDMIQLEHLLSPEASSLDDVQWKHQLNLCLTTSNLLDQFKEIAAYEVYDDL